MTAVDPLVRAARLERRFGEQVAVEGVDMAVDPGEVVGLLGANGAGKTTLVRLILGLLRPTAGTVETFGEAPSDAARRRIGYLPQGQGLYQDLTAAEQLAFTARIYGVARPRSVALTHEDHRFVGDLPLGAKRHLAFEVATLHDPDLVLLDEPTSGVDPLGRARLWDRIRQLADGGKGVLVSTHYMSEAEQCDRLIIMARGRVVASGTPQQIIARRTSVTVCTDYWPTAFAVLESAGMSVALAGSHLRVVGDSAGQDGTAHTRLVLRAADIQADVGDAPATLEEVFVGLARGPAADDDAGARSR